MIRGRPFEPGNKFGRGRPRGSRNRRNLKALHLMEEHSESLMRKALVLALQGDISMLRMFVDRLVPRVKDLPVKVDSLPTNTISELVQAQGSVLQQVTSGRLTPSQGQQVNELLESRRRFVETAELERRVQALESCQAENNETP